MNRSGREDATREFSREDFCEPYERGGEFGREVVSVEARESIGWPLGWYFFSLCLMSDFRATFLGVDVVRGLGGDENCAVFVPA